MPWGAKFHPMPKYDDCLLTYLDILGFSKMIEESVSNPAKIERIIEILIEMERQTSLGARDGSSNALTQNFSDLIIRAVPLEEPSEFITKINIECLILASIQCKLLLDNSVLIRGGICYDKIYMEQGLAFGPALVKSHHLAEHVSVYPRVIVDPKVAAMHDVSAELPLRSLYLRQGDDGAYFLDYLSIGFMFQVNFFPKYESPIAVALKHKERVEEKLSELKSHERIRQKALWLAIYHNHAVRRIMGFANFKYHAALQSCLIPEPHE